ncbi:tetratricopeptide (TPR) repeat protein [Paenibacillus xylanexedens]|uniref:DNA-binding protein n=1 Tax=Paenibacillus xylanexedens TaxID=528191 RepID=UPI0020A20A2B|nr:DNA-binding protein [Paenibacillus xylanexedens]MCP1423867.1 tetratricopeptide (TPR) repeat protein [Paenibacillus xylanexedens]
MRKSILKSLKPDIIVEMLDMAVAFENWNKVMERADMLYQCVQSFHEERQEYRSKGVPAPHINIERPLVYYYGFSHLMRGMAHQKMGQVDQARACIDQYAELGWMEDLDEVGMQAVQEFRHKAQVNRYALEIEAGQVQLLEEFVNFLLEHPEEWLVGLKVITEAAVRHRWQIDHVLQVIEDQIQGVGREIDSLNNDDVYHYCYQRACYEQWMGRPQEAVEFILKAIRLAGKLGMDQYFIRCMALLESLREEATAEQIGRYRVMLEEMK